jgi:hypothetical protein
MDVVYIDKFRYWIQKNIRSSASPFGTLCGTEYSTVVDSCKSGNEISGSIKVGIFLTSWATIRSSIKTLFYGVNKSYSVLKTRF